MRQSWDPERMGGARGVLARLLARLLVHVRDARDVRVCDTQALIVRFSSPPVVHVGAMVLRWVE